MSKSNRVLIVPIIALVLGAAVWTFMTSKKPVQTNQSDTTDNGIELPFELEGKKITVELPSSTDYKASSEDRIYKIDPYEEFFPSQNLTKAIAKKMNLSQLDENTWTRESATVKFVKSIDENYISITLSDSDPTELVEQKLIESAKEELNTLGIWPFSSKEFESNVSILEEVNLSGTKAFVTFSEKINSKTIIADSKEFSEIYVKFDKEGKISEIIYFYVPYKIEETEMKEYKVLDEIKNSLENGEYKRLNPSLSITSLKVSSIETTYYVATSSNHIQPVILVSGKTQSGENIELLVPAFKNENYD